MVGKKDRDPNGISASMKLVAEIADLTEREVGWTSYITLSRLQRKARRIRGKFRGKK